MGVTNKKQLVRTLKTGKGIQHLLNAASAIFANPILMHDVEYKLMAHTECTVTDDPYWNELVAKGEHSMKSLKFFKNECFMDYVANAETVAILTSPKLKYDRVFGKIFNKHGIMVACADIVCCYRPYDDEDIEAFEAFCKRLSREIGRSEYYQVYGQMYQETLVKKLIDESIADRALYSCHLANIYHGLKENLFLAVADISRCSLAGGGLDSVRDMLVSTQPAYRYSIYSDYIVVIISSSDEKLNIKKNLPLLSAFFERYGIFAGVSGRFENLFELGRRYNEALCALRRGLESQSRIFLYDWVAGESPA